MRAGLLLSWPPDSVVRVLALVLEKFPSRSRAFVAPRRRSPRLFHGVLDGAVSVCHRSKELGRVLDVLVHVLLQVAHSATEPFERLVQRARDLLLVDLEGLLK